MSIETFDTKTNLYKRVTNQRVMTRPNASDAPRHYVHLTLYALCTRQADRSSFPPFFEFNFQGAMSIALMIPWRDPPKKSSLPKNSASHLKCSAHVGSSKAKPRKKPDWDVRIQLPSEVQTSLSYSLFSFNRARPMTFRCTSCLQIRHSASGWPWCRRTLRQQGKS